MAGLPAPNLDDRRFQDLVDEAKRLVQQRCPEWTDHNVSDPGVTLIETFAFMVDQLLYRLNRVPDRNYLRFLDLIGVKLHPPAAATAPVTFWLSAPQEQAVTIPARTEVATLRTETEEAIAFATVEDLPIVACSLAALASADAIDGNGLREHPAGQPFFCFDKVPQPGDALLVGLSNPVPSCAVLLRIDSRVEGIGVNPDDPPLAWEAWDGEGWVACDLDRDTTGGFNVPGDVVLHVPPSHTASVHGAHSGGWLRCRVTPPILGQPAYSASPRIDRIVASTVGGTTAAVHGEIVLGEDLGVSEGVAGQAFPLRGTPVIDGTGPLTLEVSTDDGWEEWTQVESFAGRGPSERVFVLDGASVALGPAVREADGTVVHHGAVPPQGARLRIPLYRTGGGGSGNVARRALSVLRSSIPYVSAIENRQPAGGGVDAETVPEARIRGPLQLRSRDRAVTAEDYEHLARVAAPEAARVRCVPAPVGNGADASPGDDAGGVRVLVVPAVADGEHGRIDLASLVPSDATLERIAGYLDERRMIGARVRVEPPRYQGITVVARLRARSDASAARVERAALGALYGWFHPLRGGAAGIGWPFGRAVHVGEIYAALQRVPGVEFVEDARLFGADPATGQRGESATKIDLDPNTLVFSYEHRVRVET
jgi:predicted phage baseplate assembly protein